MSSYSRRISATKRISAGWRALLSAEEKIHCWNVDLGDIDKVLRIEAEELTTGQVTH